MKKILAFTNFAPKETNITKAALTIAEKINANLLLADAAKEAESEFSLFRDREKAGSLLKDEHLQSPSTRADEEYVSGHSLVEGPVAELNYKQLDDKEIGLVISGTSPASNLAADEEAMNILGRNYCPLLLLPRGKDLKKISRVGFITDIRFCDEAITTPLSRFCREMGAGLILIHVNTSGLPEIGSEYAEDIFNNHVYPRLNHRDAVFVQLFGKDAVSELENVNEVIRPDILAVCRKRYGFYDRLFQFRGNPEPKYSEVPLMIYP